MRRRVTSFALLGLIVLTALAILHASAKAQQVGRVYRIGFLSDSRQPWDDAFRRGLRELGYVAGENTRIEDRYGQGKLERLPSLARELVNLNGEVVGRRRHTCSIRGER